MYRDFIGIRQLGSQEHRIMQLRLSKISAVAASIAAASLIWAVDALAEPIDRSCLVDSESTLHESLAESVKGLFLVAVSDDSGVIQQLGCEAGSLQQATVRMEVGERAEIGLLIANPGDEAVQVGNFDRIGAKWATGWGYLNVSRAEVPAGGFLPITLVVHVPADYAPGNRKEHTFHLTNADDALSVTVRLEVVAEQPLFRDGFDIDPVLGQFSQRQGDTSDSKTHSAASFVGPE
jgi:hypothetical protein